MSDDVPTPARSGGDPNTARRPVLLAFDVNETLSDMAPMAGRFKDVGAPGHLAKTWFAGLLRDGFALTVSAVSEPFARIAQESLRTSLGALPLDRDIDDAVAHVMAGFAELAVHPDVPEGLRRLREQDIRLVTLSNGAAAVAQRLLEQAGVRELVEQVLSVEDAGAWKPAAAAYSYALDRCGVSADDAMLVAVHPWDTDGAARAGLRTAWVDRAGSSYPAYFTAPTVRATSLVDLAHQLR